MTNANPLELAMLDMINNERAEAGLEELRLLTLLNSAAENHSNWMLDTDVFSHEGLNGSSPSDRMEIAGYDFMGNSLALENIGWQSARGAEGYEDDVGQIHEGLMASPGHRANILSPDAEDIGIGIEIGTFTSLDNDYEAVMVTQVFGTTTADLSAWVDPGNEDAGDEMLVEGDMVATDETPVVEDDVVTDDEPTIAEDEASVAEDDLVDDIIVCDTDDEVTMDDTDNGLDDLVSDDGDDESIADAEDISEDEETSNEQEDNAEDDETDNDEADDAMDEDTEEENEDEADEQDYDENIAESDSENANGDAGEDASVVSDGPNDMEQPDPTMSPPLPCDLADFRVDLRDAFEFRQEGDQLIWETSEDRLTEVFMKAFEDWSSGEVETVEDMPTTTGIEDLMMDEVSDADLNWVNADEEPTEDWLFDTCA